MTREPVLKIDNLESYYGPIMAIRGVSLEVREGQIVDCAWSQWRRKNHIVENHIRGDGPGQGYNSAKR